MRDTDTDQTEKEKKTQTRDSALSRAARQKREREAERKRWQRTLEKADYARVPVYVHRRVIDHLIARGLVTEADRENRDIVGASLGMLLDEMMDWMAVGVFEP